MDVRIRNGTGDDAEAVARAHVRAWQKAYAGVVPADYLAALDIEERTREWRRNFTETTLPSGMPSPRNLVADVAVDEDQRQVVGFSCVGVWRDEPAPELGELWAMYVHPDHWGTGVGYSLMRDTVAHFRSTGVTTAYLWVLEENPRAKQFYQRQGWLSNDVTKNDEIGGVTIVERRYSLDLT